VNIVSPESNEKMWTGMINSNHGIKNPQYCLGWIREDFLGTTLIGHCGNMSASSNSMQLLPEKKIGVLVGQNMDNDLTEDLGRGVLAILLGEEPATVLPKLPVMKKLSPILGTYIDHTGSSIVSLEFEGPGLMLSQKTADFPEIKFPIIPIDMDKLTFKIATPLFDLSEIKFFLMMKTRKPM